MGAAERLMVIPELEVYEIEINFDDHLYSCVSVGEVIDYEYATSDYRIFVDFYPDLGIKTIEVLTADYDEVPDYVSNNLVNKLEKVGKRYYKQFNASIEKEPPYHYLNA